MMIFLEPSNFPTSEFRRSSDPRLLCQKKKKKSDTLAPSPFPFSCLQPQEANTNPTENKCTIGLVQDLRSPLASLGRQNLLRSIKKTHYSSK